MTTARRRPKRRGTDARTALRNVPILADIDDEQLERLATTVERRHVPANQWLFHAGEPADSIYIVDSGRFVAVAPEGHVFAEMASGDSIGDLGVIAGAARSAGVRALRDGVVWRIAAETFTDMLEATPLLQSAMLRAMARMLRQSRPAKTARRPRVIGVVSNGDTAAAPMVDAIATSLDSHGRTAVIAPPVETTSAVQEYDELVEAFSETLDRAERSNDWVLVVADRGAGDLWRHYVSAQSDRLVVLVDQRYPPDAVDSLATQRPVHLITCLAEPDPSWWDRLAPVSHHPANSDGFGALARRIAGRSLGLVMAVAEPGDWRISVFTKSSPKPASSSIGLAEQVRVQSLPQRSRWGWTPGMRSPRRESSSQEATHSATTRSQYPPSREVDASIVWCRDSSATR